ncbi:MAG: sigma-54-dependent transcriptional regulator [Syntrophobacteraceae bacterium]
MAVKILVIDDEKDMLLLLQRILSDKTSYQVTLTDDPTRVVDLLKESTFDVVFTDLKMPNINGIQVLEAVKAKDPGIAVILMTAYGTIESAIEATRKGATDYITKPFRKERILHVLEKALQWQGLQRENNYLREKLEGRSLFPTLIGSSAAMRLLQDQIDRVARTTATVLITGESGTGKELVAHAIHALSLRKDKPFVPINCSTIPETMIETELFGHLRGSFTGALRDKKGLIEEANQGTLFLDEIGDLSLTLQVKLLRLIQEGEYKVVGSNTLRKVDIRLIAATHQPLVEKIRKGEFREDLYYRLNVINIRLPPLRERRTDIPLLCRHFLQKYSVLHGKKVNGFSARAMDYLMKREWPGNVREIENTVERGVIMATDDAVDLPDVLGLERPVEGSSSDPSCPTLAADEIFTMPFKEAKDKLMEEFQAQYISKILAKHSGNVSQAAKESGIKRQYLHRLMRDTQVDSKSFKKTEHTD